MSGIYSFFLHLPMPPVGQTQREVLEILLRGVSIAGLMAVLQDPASKVGPWLVPGNLDIRRVPTSP